MSALRPIFLSSFLFSIHLALLTYLNSSMLRKFSTPTVTSMLYMGASALSIALLMLIPSVIKHRGLIRTTVFVLFVSSILLFGIGTTSTPLFIALFFVLYFSLNVTITYFFDLLVEHYSRAKTTGTTRGAFLMINNIGWVAAPLTAGLITTRFGQSSVYLIASMIVLCAAALILMTQGGFKDKVYQHGSLWRAFRSLGKEPGIRRIVTLNLLLQLFFAWMVVYSPLYLSTLGFNWKQIGLVFSIMLLPFVLFEYPAGKLADRYGEKSLITLGLFIASLMTLCFALMHTTSVFVYAALLFGTRTGASIMEVACDSYFFKHTSDRDTALVSLYRSMFPLAYILGPIAGSVLLGVISYPSLFVVLSAALLIALLYSFRFKY